ncbi:hypothetical protein TIFTF001_050012 [Ficus carica]|uniref:Uncharacterized protein n=1 Tax=Ficus carica TaxID=3494 RepID=A0AA87Z1L0_FICCA|nr:hypothetical protein TIFTF001_050012 [Ficus carica]
MGRGRICSPDGLRQEIGFLRRREHTLEGGERWGKNSTQGSTKKKIRGVHSPNLLPCPASPQWGELLLCGGAANDVWESNHVGVNSQQYTKFRSLYNGSMENPS